MSKGLEGVVATETSISSIIGKSLTYRGITIEELAEKATFEEVIHLLWFGKLPNKEELLELEEGLFDHLHLSNQMKDFLTRLPREGNKMELLRTCVSALPLFEEDTQNNKNYRKLAVKIQAQMASLVCAIARHSEGKVPLEPLKKLNFSQNFCYMMFGHEPSDIETEAINKALILHADHELNASTFSSRVTVATLSDIYSGMTSAIGTLKGPLHGGANEQVIKMLLEIGSLENVEPYVRGKMERKEKVMGIGHRVYRDGDPRAFILKEMSKKLTTITGEGKWYQMSEKIEKMVLEEKGLKPNVDFYSASVYYSMGIPPEIFTPIFAVSRTSGWVAHMIEQYENNRLIRPRAEYVGPVHQSYIPMEER